MSSQSPPQLTVLLPCLNEARTVGDCIAEASAALINLNIPSEILVADNGSNDGSGAIAERAGARVVKVPDPGYGCAIRAGVAASEGEFIVIADCDGSYDLSDISPLFERLQAKSGMIVGNRLRGTIHPGAMPFLNRYLGTPVITAIGRFLIGIPVGDFNCGIRAFRKDDFLSLNLTSSGMELASEMLVKAHLAGIPLGEVPVSLRKDGRDRPPHLRPWRDGIRHLYQIMKHAPHATKHRLRRWCGSSEAAYRTPTE